jgi:hypothetical protein|nr:MAG TPA_asm: RimK-related lysine biosynthesis protein, Probable-dependent amine/thiol ligase family Amino-group [Caudoviricetes sp.]
MSRKFTDEEVVEAALCCTAKSCDTCPFIVLGEGFEKCIIKFSEYIANNTKNEPVPTADVQEVKHGTWENTNTPNQLRCSNCEIIHFIAQYPHGEINYCPNCGTRMDGDSL